MLHIELYSLSAGLQTAGLQVTAAQVNSFKPERSANSLSAGLNTLLASDAQPICCCAFTPTVHRPMAAAS